MRTVRIFSLLQILSAIALAPSGALAMISRHNEQGLSPTHTYKRSGPDGVISNLNGNLVVSSTAGQFAGAPLGVSVTRTWNSHWRDPLFVHQFDMDPSSIDFKNVRKPVYSDHHYDYVSPVSIAGFASHRIMKYDNPVFVPNGWAFASAIGVQMLQPIVQEAVMRALDQQLNGAVTHLYQSINEKTAAANLLGKSFDPKSLTQSEQETLSKVRLAGATVQAAFYLAQGGMDDLRALNRCIQNAADGKTASGCGNAAFNVAQVAVAPFEWGGTAASALSYAQMGYRLANGEANGEDLAWFFGNEIARYIVGGIVGGGMAGGFAGVAVSAAIQLTRVYIQMVDFANKTFDVANVNVAPWALGVNGRLGILGVNHENERRKPNGRFHVEWTELSKVPTGSGKGASTRQVSTPNGRSLHPAPDLQLVGSDGGASRFILSDDSAISKNGWKWYAYVSLSDADQRKIYYARPAALPEVFHLGADSNRVKLAAKADSLSRLDSGYYVVKDPDGTIAEYGRGGHKSIDSSYANYHTYWAVPTRITHPTGDTVEIVRDGSQNLVRTFDLRTGRGFEVVNSTGGVQRVIGRVWDTTTLKKPNPTIRSIVDTTLYGVAPTPYNAFASKDGGFLQQNFDAVTWEAHRVSATQIDTTRFGYTNGDLTSIRHANGSLVKYTYPSERQSALDGFVMTDAEYPDENDPTVMTKHVYDYVGWAAKDPPVLKTSVTTILTQPNHIVHDSATRTSEITDWYTFGPMVAAINVNRKLAGYQARTTVVANGKLTEVDKLQDSLEYRTTRFQMVREIHGVGSPSMSRTQWVYVGDRPQGKIESRGYGQVWDPRVTVWEYDREGSVLRERVCPQDLAKAVAANLAGIPLGGTLKMTCPEISTTHGMRHVETSEFWSIRRDTLRTDSAKVWQDIGIPNPSFSPYGQYQLGLETSKRTWRTNALGQDSALVADSTEYEDWQPGVNAPTWMRAVRSRVYDPGKMVDDWPEVSRTAFADNLNRPTLPARVWRRMGLDSAALTESVCDPTYRLYPIESRSYLKAVPMGAAGTAPYLATTRIIDLNRGWVLSETAPGNRTTSTTYDRLGRPLTKTAPDGGVTRTQYVDRLQNVATWRNMPEYSPSSYPAQRTVAVRETDPAGVSTEARFDGMGRLVAVRKIAAGAVNSLDTAVQQTTLVSYNIFDKLQWKRDPDGREEFHDYDETGRLSATKQFVTPAAGVLSLAWQSSYEWNDSARRMTEIDPSGTRTVFSWDGHDRDTLIERDSGLLSSQFGGERSAGLVPQKAAGKIQVRQRYANTGELLGITDPKGLVESRKYDRRGRLTETVYPDDLRHAVGYDLAGRVIRDTLVAVSQPANPVTKSLQYDGLDRLVRESYGTNARENTSYAWDSYAGTADTGQLMAVVRGTGLVAKYNYDKNGRRLQRAVDLGGVNYSANMSTTFDLGGATLRQTLPGGARVAQGYDPYHRFASLSLVQGADSVALMSEAKYRRNDLADGFRLGSRLRAKSSYEPQRAVLTTNMVTRTKATNPAAIQDTLLMQRLEWDASGNVTGMLRPLGDTVAYRHDRLGQLRITNRPGGMDTLAFDPNGNRTRHRFTLDGRVSDTFAYNGNRIIWARTARNGHTLYRHDVLGNLTLEASFAVPADTANLAKAWRIVERRWNRRNELERVVVKNRLAKDSTIWAYDYDESNNRIAKRYAAAMDTSTWKLERRYVYDGVNVVADSGRGDSSWTWHAFQGYRRLALATKPAAKLRVRYLLTDHLGTANVVTDDTGRVLSKYSLDPWGNVEASWETTPLRWLYTGKEWDAEVGGMVTYVNARYLDNERGAWVGRDVAEQFNSPYEYVGNQSLTGLDPDGQSTILDGGGIVSSVSNNGNTDIVLQADLGNSCSEKVIGKTQYWDEFHRGVKVNQGVDISGYVSYLINSYSEFDSESKKSSSKFGAAISAGVLANASRSKAIFDIKQNLNSSQGYLLNGYYVSGESAGNYLFGRNVNVLGMSWTSSMWLAGAYHIWSNRRFGSESYVPYYGETDYAGRQIRAGYFHEY